MIDHDWLMPAGSFETGSLELDRELLLPTRAEALAACRSALAAGAGPALVTGEPGSGKTWLATRVAGELPAHVRCAWLDLTATADTVCLLRSIAHHLGLVEPRSPSELRLALGDHLRELAADGHRWLLVLDEAHTASSALLEDVRVLSNRLGQPDGFWGLLLLGQTCLARRLATQPLRAFHERLGAHVHLRPLDADEAHALVAHHWPHRAVDRGILERWHRDAAGNPRRLLRLAAEGAAVLDEPGPPRAAIPPRPQLQPDPEPQSPPVRSEPPPRPPAEPAAHPVPAAPVPLLGAARPPIHEEDGLIEVGWEPAAEPSPALAASVDVATRSGTLDVPSDADEEAINDHYAALQAWNEWARNQGRGPAVSPAAVLPTDLAEASEEELRADGQPQPTGTAQVWAEGPDRFAPYSQLFTRLRQSRDQD